MSEEVSIHGGVVRVTDARVLSNSRYNRIKADNSQNDLSVHFTTVGETAPGPREALLVHIVSGIHPTWLQVSGYATSDDEVVPVEAADIHFRAISAEACTDKPYDVGEERPAIKATLARSEEATGLFDMLHMSTVERGNMTRLQLTMTNESSHIMHGGVVMNKSQVTQMIASLLVLYSRLHED